MIRPEARARACPAGRIQPLCCARLLSLLLVGPASVVASDLAPSRSASTEDAVSTAIIPYLGFSAGGGPSWVTIDGAPDHSAGWFLGARAGVEVGAKCALDLNATGLVIPESFSFPRENPTNAIRLFNVYAAATLIPISNFLLRGGLGAGWLSGTNGWDAPSSPWSSRGLMLLGGVGYRVWASEAATFSFNVDGLVHRYGVSAWNSEAVICSLGFDVHFGTARRGR
jgi:hypothetical protein